MGYSLNEVLGHHSTDFMTEESSRYAKEVILPKFYETGSCRDVPYQYVKKNGEVMDALLSAIAENDETGELIHSLSVIIDVTDRKQAEDSLKQSEEKFRSLVESINDWIWEVDENGIYTYSSPKVRELLGYEPEEVTGKTPFEFMPDDEAERVKNIYTQISNSRESFKGLENKNIHKNGEIF